MNKKIDLLIDTTISQTVDLSSAVDPISQPTLFGSGSRSGSWFSSCSFRSGYGSGAEQDPNPDLGSYVYSDPDTAPEPNWLIIIPDPHPDTA